MKYQRQYVIKYNIITIIKGTILTRKRRHVNVVVVVVIIIIVRHLRLSINHELCDGNQITPLKAKQHNRKRISTLIIGCGGDRKDMRGWVTRIRSKRSLYAYSCYY